MSEKASALLSALRLNARGLAESETVEEALEYADVVFTLSSRLSCALTAEGKKDDINL